MKKLLVNLIFAVAAALSFQACSARYVASGPPPYPTETVVVAPSPYHVWVPGRYIYSGNRYAWSPGYYRVPPHGRTTYVEGRWNQTGRGYRYQRGRWR